MRSEDLSIESLAKNPQAILLLLKQQNIQLIELKALKNDFAKSQDLNVQFRGEREDLRIEVATLRERDTVSLLEIPVSITSGFAITMLTTNITSGFGDLPPKVVPNVKLVPTAASRIAARPAVRGDDIQGSCGV